jgi:PAS domain S-box-containing protein
MDIILADLNAADQVKSNGLPSDLDLSTIQANLENLRTVIANSAGQDVDYFRQILNVANAGLVDLWRETLAHPRAFTPDAVMADSKAPAPQPSLLTPLRRLEALLVLVAILISWITWKYNQQTVSLAHINSKLDKAIETSLDAVIITDAQGKVTTYNIAAEEMFGLTFSNVEGAFVEDLLTSGSLKFEKRKLSGRQISASLARSANRGRMRLKLQRNDGVCIMVEVAVISDKDSNGQLIYIAFLRDISKLVQSDLAERAVRREAERSSAANARFLAVMSHEMRTPLHGIMTALELMEDTETEDKKVMLRQIARDCAGSALEQIEEVLELSLHDVPDVF